MKIKEPEIVIVAHYLSYPDNSLKLCAALQVDDTRYIITWDNEAAGLEYLSANHRWVANEKAPPNN